LFFCVVIIVTNNKTPHMKKNYLTKQPSFTLPKEETIKFLLSYSKGLSLVGLNGLINNLSLYSKEN